LLTKTNNRLIIGGPQIFNAMWYINLRFTYLLTYLLIWWWWWWIDEVNVRPVLQFRNSHECASEDMLQQTVQFLVHAGTRMIVDSYVAVLTYLYTYSILFLLWVLYSVLSSVVFYFYTARWPCFICISAHYKYVMMMVVVMDSDGGEVCSWWQIAACVLFTGWTNLSLSDSSSTGDRRLYAAGTHERRHR